MLADWLHALNAARGAVAAFAAQLPPNGTAMCSNFVGTQQKFFFVISSARK